MKYSCKILFIIIITFLLFSCEKEKVKTPVNYKNFSSIISPEGGKIRFFENNSNIHDSLFPSIIIPPNTFIDTSLIRINYVSILPNNLPDQLTSFSVTSYLWFFNTNNTELKKPVSIIIPFSQPMEYLLLDKYKNLFRIFKINPDEETTVWENWMMIEDSSVDTTFNFIEFETENLNYGYCILFNEIKCNDVYILEITGEINDIHQYAKSSYTKLKDNSENRSYLICTDNICSYSNFSESKGVNYLILFSFEGNNAGHYSGNDIYIKYYYNYLNSNTWEYIFENTTDSYINITEFGNIGSEIDGNIIAELESVSGGNYKININMSFKFIRVR